MKVPFIDITRFEAGFTKRWLDKVSAMSSAAQFVGGAEVAALEKRLAELLGIDHAIGCANGTDALQLALRALGVGAGDTVLVPNATFWATFEAVVNVGARPATIDVALSDGGVDLVAFERALEKEKPKAAILVHLYGWGSGNLSEIRALCARHGVLLLEDGAQCFGTIYKGESVLKGALISTTSFYPAKVLGAAGDGGAVFTNNGELADRVRRLGNHGRTAHYGYGDVGWNSRLDALQAAFLNISLDYIEARIASRRKSVAIYRELLPAELEKLLKERSIGFANIYPGVMSAQVGAAPYLKGHYGGDNAERLCESVLNLPLFPYMTEEEIGHVVSVVRESEA
jgi:UDP-2-acetamido-2-deoxy-ribo-hexuluronate aminotransferase